MRNLATVIIPNWNGIDLLRDCLSSLQKQTFKDFETIVVDNHSSDDSVDFIQKNFPKVKVLILEKNYGFAKAINEGVKKSNTPYVVFLNNDTEVDKEWLNVLVKAAKVKKKEFASFGSKLLNFYDRKKIDGVGIEVNEVGQAKSIGWDLQDNGQYEKEMEVFGVTGGASLFIKDIFIKVGGFDEQFFMYLEEVDWAFRAQFKGYKALYCPGAIVYHKHKASSKKKPQLMEYWQFRNMSQMIIKDFPAKILFKDYRLIKIILVHLNTYAYQIKNGFFWPPFAADLWLLLHLPQLLSERKKIQFSIQVDLNQIEKFLHTKKVTFWGLKK